MTRQTRERLRYLAEAVPLLRKAREDRQATDKPRSEPRDAGKAFLGRIVGLMDGSAEKAWRTLLASGSEAKLVADLRRIDDMHAPRSEAPSGCTADERAAWREVASSGETFVAAIDRLSGDPRRADLVRALCRRRRIGEKGAAAIIADLGIGHRGANAPAPTAGRILSAVKRATRMQA